MPLIKEKESFLNDVTIDCVVFSFYNGNLGVLLEEQVETNGVVKWRLPSGEIYREESTDAAAHRLLYKYGLFHNLFLEQLRLLGTPVGFL